MGEWHYPDGTIVNPEYIARNNGSEFYRSRGDEGNVILNRFHSSVMSPTGLFCCVVPNAEGISQILCAYICKYSCELRDVVKQNLIILCRSYNFS